MGVDADMLADVVAEAQRLLRRAEQADIPVRLIGGVAVRLHVADLPPAFRREVRDIDLVTRRNSARRLSELLEREGYEPDQTFNSLHGAHRMLFYDRVHERQLDVFVNGFKMCHVLPIVELLEEQPHTVTLADLLLTKLQIYALNLKDRHDAYALLLEHELGAGDSERVDVQRIARLCATDWGLFRTVTLNFERLRIGLEDTPLTSEQRARLEARIVEIVVALHAAPKGAKWRMRARVGDRVQWYEEPDEINE